MIKILLLATILGNSLVWACPDIEGKWNCLFNEEKSEIQVYISEQEVRLVVEYIGMDSFLDRSGEWKEVEIVVESEEGEPKIIAAKELLRCSAQSLSLQQISEENDEGLEVNNNYNFMLTPPNSQLLVILRRNLNGTANISHAQCTKK